jgi:prepilin-type N-terminal cleavage/methylation domain-containing protein
MNARRAGFTLIELLIVVVIIGILAAIAIPKFSSTREKSFLAAMKSDLRNLATQQDIYHNNNFTYSTNTGAIGFVNSDGVLITISEATGTGWAATATHIGYPGSVCELFQGSATPTGPATIEGSMECVP